MMIVCMQCKKFFHPLKNGVYVEEGKPGFGKNYRTETGWSSYKLWAADLVHCRECETEIVTGFASRPIAEHFKPDYNEIRDALLERDKLMVFIEDCP